MARSRKKESLEIDADWLPTPNNVNALPEPLRRYIHDLIANCDPGYLIQQNSILRQHVDELTVLVDAMKRSRKKRTQVTAKK
jgi:hypothetical protein